MRYRQQQDRVTLLKKEHKQKMAILKAQDDAEVRIVLREVYLAGSSQEAVVFTQHMGKRTVGQKHKAGMMALEIAENEKSFSGLKPERD